MHSPEVLADLVARLRRDPAVGALYRNPTAAALLEANPPGGAVYVLERVELEALVSTSTKAPPLEFDRFATAVLCVEGSRQSKGEP
jgi:hypothetical protein